jgi:hypothetical protein
MRRHKTSSRQGPPIRMTRFTRFQLGVAVSIPVLGSNRGRRCRGQGTNLNSCGIEYRKLKICGPRNSSNVSEKCPKMPATVQSQHTPIRVPLYIYKRSISNAETGKVGEDLQCTNRLVCQSVSQTSGRWQTGTGMTMNQVNRSGEGNNNNNDNNRKCMQPVTEELPPSETDCADAATGGKHARIVCRLPTILTGGLMTKRSLVVQGGAPAMVMPAK